MKSLDKTKKKAIIYGNCHTSAIKDVLARNELFSKEYYFFEIPAIQNIKKGDFFKKEIFEDCDLFIHQSIRKDNRYGEDFASENIIRMLNAKCMIIAIPNLYHLPKCFFPQYTEDPALKTMVRNKTIFFRDSIIDERLSKENRGTINFDDIVSDYMDENRFDNRKIQNEYKLFIEKVYSREKDWDIKIADFLDQNHKTKQLFFDPNHPTNFVIEYIAYRVIQLLFPDVGVRFEETSETCGVRLDTYEMPICASVKKALDLEYGEKELRLSGRKECCVPMNIYQYIKQYSNRIWADKTIPYRKRIVIFFRWLVMKTYNLPAAIKASPQKLHYIINRLEVKINKI